MKGLRALMVKDADTPFSRAVRIDSLGSDGIATMLGKSSEICIPISIDSDTKIPNGVSSDNHRFTGPSSPLSSRDVSENVDHRPFIPRGLHA